MIEKINKDKTTYNELHMMLISEALILRYLIVRAVFPYAWISLTEMPMEGGQD
jgi:hypothetical protein